MIRPYLEKLLEKGDDESLKVLKDQISTHISGGNVIMYLSLHHLLD